ncbi:Flavonoid 3'-monooxygenase [Linum grandiflorum]
MSSTSTAIICDGIIIATAIYLLLNLLALLRQRGRKPLPPGPTPWPIVGNLPHLGSMPHHTIAALARRYGPLLYLRLGYVDVVVAASASVAAQFLKHNDSNFADRPQTSGGKYMAYGFQDMVFAPYGPRWKLLRKVSAVHLFSGKALDNFRHVRQREVASLTRALASAGGAPVEVGLLISLCTTNALGRALVGKQVFGDITGGVDPRAEKFKTMVVELMTLAGIFNIGDFIPAIEFLDLQGIAARMKNVHNNFDDFLNQILVEYRKTAHEDDASGGHVDFLSSLMSLRVADGPDGVERQITDTEIKALLLNMFSAGTDTSSSTVEWGVAELIRHPKILAQLQTELDNAVGRDRVVSEVDILELPYLNAVVKEIFRLHPPTPLSLPRMAAESCEINGFHIPKGATLLVNVWGIGRDPDVWSDPLRFDPGRFLPGGEKARVGVKGSDFELIPFGAGRRICSGMSLGLRTVQLMTAVLAHGFDWELEGVTAEELNMDEVFGISLQRAVPLVVRPKARLAPHAYQG